MSQTYYEVLSVSPDASDQEIRRAYRDAARQAHPDKVQGEDASIREASEAQMRQLNRAYEVLGSREARATYDRCLAEGVDYEALVQEAASADPEVVRREGEASEDFEAILVETALVVAQAIRDFEPGIHWRDEDETVPGFHTILVGVRGAQRFRVHVRVCPELYVEDVADVLRFATSYLEARHRGLLREAYSFFLVTRFVHDPAAVYERVRAFNERAWHRTAPRAPRAFVAYTEEGKPFPFVPGALAPVPNLAELEIHIREDESDGPPPADGPGASTADPDPPGRQGKILVVDDDEGSNAFLSEVLEERGHHVRTAHDWGSFKKGLMAGPLDLLILDVRLPQVGGDELALFVKHNPDIQPKPAIVLYSVLPLPELEQLASRIGAAAVIAKGESDQRILECVGQVLDEAQP